MRLLEAHTRVPIQEGQTLLFLDEVQAAAGVLARLRYFAEELPGLHVIAAGSLLDFTLRDHALSMVWNDPPSSWNAPPVWPIWRSSQPMPAWHSR